MIKKGKRSALLIASGAVALQLAAGLVVATPAQASVWDCETGNSVLGPWGKCRNSSSGYYKANVNCRNFFTKTWTKVSTGPAQHINSQQPSVVPGCGIGQEFYGPIFMTE